MPDGDVLVEQDGPVAVVTLNRPGRSNAFTLEALAALWRSWEDLDADPNVRVAVLTGAGERAFCAGRDLVELGEDRDHAREVERWRPPGAPDDWLPRLLPEIGKPTIAAINGAAMGGGFALAQRCDLRVASRDAFFATPEIRYGLGAGNFLVELVRLVPPAVAMEMVQLGHRLDAATALRIGFVNRVVESEDVLPTAREWAHELAERSPEALRANKELVRHATMPDSDALWQYAQSILEPLRQAGARFDDDRMAPQ